MDGVLILGALLVISWLYYGAALTALIRFSRSSSVRSARPDSPSGVSLLKPAVGAGGEFAALLRSHASQDFPEFEILVGAGTGDSDARSAVSVLRSEFPNLHIELIECPDPSPGCNAKVEVLESLARHARNPIWVVSDADIRVPPGYLHTLCSELSEPNTGLVTCLYGAQPGAGLASVLQATRINTEFAAQVLVARWIPGPRFGLGSTLAFHAETLEKVGGFKSLRGLIGDDYQLGVKVAAQGLGVELSAVSVSTQLPLKENWKETWRRELRWSRTIRKQRPGGHAALPLSFGTLWACAAIAVTPETLWPQAAICLGLRLATAALTMLRVRGVRDSRTLCLVPVADLWACAAWTWSYLGNRVSWAGRQMKIGTEGRILKQESFQP